MLVRSMGLLAGVLALCAQTGCQNAPPAAPAPAAQQTNQPDTTDEAIDAEPTPAAKPKTTHLDLSGRRQVGRATYYSSRFTNRPMAGGGRFDPNAHIAASRTLPIGTVARVTNLTNGKSTMVTIRDRGPLTGGRVVDVAPKVADELDFKQAGVARVAVTPVAVPQADGRMKPGAAAGEETASAAR